jgi:hypothetical protein
MSVIRMLVLGGLGAACLQATVVNSANLDAQSCVTAKVTVTPAGKASEGRTELLLSNQCNGTRAVLVEPIEVRIRTGRELFVWEGPDNPRNAFATLYVFRKDVGLDSAFRGDAVRTIRGAPKVVSVSPGSSRVVPVVGLGEYISRLPPGEYSCFLLTASLSPPLDDVLEATETVDARMDVNRHNTARRKEEPFLLRRAEQIRGETAAFLVE